VLQAAAQELKQSLVTPQVQPRPCAHVFMPDGGGDGRKSRSCAIAKHIVVRRMACRRNCPVGAGLSADASPFLDYQPHMFHDTADSLSCVESRIMYALLFVQFSLESFYDPARRALTTELVRRQPMSLSAAVRAPSSHHGTQQHPTVHFHS